MLSTWSPVATPRPTNLPSSVPSQSPTIAEFPEWVLALNKSESPKQLKSLPKFQRFVLMGDANNETSAWLSWFNATGNELWNIHVDSILGFNCSSVAVAILPNGNLFWVIQAKETLDGFGQGVVLVVDYESGDILKVQSIGIPGSSHVISAQLIDVSSSRLVLMGQYDSNQLFSLSMNEWGYHSQLVTYKFATSYGIPLNDVRSNGLLQYFSKSISVGRCNTGTLITSSYFHSPSGTDYDIYDIQHLISDTSINEVHAFDVSTSTRNIVLAGEIYTSVNMMQGMLVYGAIVNGLKEIDWQYSYSIDGSSATIFRHVAFNTVPGVLVADSIIVLAEVDQAIGVLRINIAGGDVEWALLFHSSNGDRANCGDLSITPRGDIVLSGEIQQRAQTSEAFMITLRGDSELLAPIPDGLIKTGITVVKSTTLNLGLERLSMRRAYISTASQELGADDISSSFRSYLQRWENPLSQAPSARPTTAAPTFTPSAVPTVAPSAVPTAVAPTGTSRPTFSGETNPPTGIPSGAPTNAPTCEPSSYPSGSPSSVPSLDASSMPSSIPSSPPTNSPVFPVDSQSASFLSESWFEELLYLLFGSWSL